jgi:hypothetical protein
MVELRIVQRTLKGVGLGKYVHAHYILLIVTLPV